MPGPQLLRHYGPALQLAMSLHGDITRWLLQLGATWTSSVYSFYSPTCQEWADWKCENGGANLIKGERQLLENAGPKIWHIIKNTGQENAGPNIAHKNERAEKCRTKLKVTFVGAVVRRSDVCKVSLAVVVVAVSDKFLYFITAAQNHTHLLKLTPLSV